MKHVAILVILFISGFVGYGFGEYPQRWIVFRSSIDKIIPTIPGWCPIDKANRMMNLIYETKPELCVEVGVFGGSSYFPTAAALQYNKKGRGYAIDPWKVGPCIEGQTGAHLAWWSKVDLNSIYKGFTVLLQRHKLDKITTVLRMTSQEALEYFEDESIDILHIDGNHAEESALYDAEHWLKKVKIGGYIWFDDTNWDSTQKAVSYLLESCQMDEQTHLKDPYMLFKRMQ